MPKGSYSRRVCYYETDQMGIMHHSNYIRWMEEARIDYLRKSGFNCAALEEKDILMPVVDVQCRYIHSLRFDETAEVEICLIAFNGVRATFEYRVYLTDGERTLSAVGTSGHCFINRTTRLPVNLRKAAREEYETGLRLLEPAQA